MKAKEARWPETRTIMKAIMFIYGKDHSSPLIDYGETEASSLVSPIKRADLQMIPPLISHQIPPSISLRNPQNQPERVDGVTLETLTGPVTPRRRNLLQKKRRGGKKHQRSKQHPL